MNYLDDGHTLRSWLATTDHKRIAILYALSITAFFFIGGAAAPDRVYDYDPTLPRPSAKAGAGTAPAVPTA